ncbi:MAG TPA: hypothetical protein ENK28_02130 [Aliiroseovarius sp.]|nr:hypothetical protein [Aliiroseovarius sp.]
MAIVNKKSTIYGSNATGYTAPNSASRAGLITRVAGTVSNEATDNAKSTYVLCDVPASAILLPESAIKTTGWGFAQAIVGVAAATTALLNVTKATGGATGNKPITIFGSNWNKPIWQQLGLADDPKVPLTLIVSTIADATGAGQIDFDLVFANHV